MILDDKGVDDLVEELNRAVENGATVKCYKRSSNEPDVTLTAGTEKRVYRVKAFYTTNHAYESFVDDYPVPDSFTDDEAECGTLICAASKQDARPAIVFFTLDDDMCEWRVFHSVNDNVTIITIISRSGAMPLKVTIENTQNEKDTEN